MAIKQLLEQYQSHEQNLAKVKGAFSAEREKLKDLETSVASIQTEASGAETALRDALTKIFVDAKARLDAGDYVGACQLLTSLSGNGFSLESLRDAYKQVEFEPRAVYEGAHKKLFRADQNLVEIPKRGFERPATCAEAMGFLIAGLDGKLSSQEMETHADMLRSYGERLDEVFGNEDDRVLHCYVHPRDFRWDAEKGDYDYSAMTSVEDCVFSLHGLKGGKYYSLEEVVWHNPDIVAHTHSRSFVNLPEAVQKNGGVVIPSVGKKWPVGRGGYGCDVGIGGVDGGSRGVRDVAVAKKSP